MTFPDAGTRICAVLGHPIGHSLSPPIHNAALRHAGVNGIYLAFDVDSSGFGPAIQGLRALGGVGCNITIPHKRAASEIADTRSRTAERVGAANTLVFTREAVTAHNTDVDGVRASLEDLGPHVVAGGKALLLGAGGAGRAAAWALVDAGADEIWVANRTAARAEELAAELTAAGHTTEVLGWPVGPDHTGQVAVILNATSVGLEDGASPLSQDALRAASVGGCRGVLDLVYGSRETPLVREARRAGIPSTDGLGALVHQAAEAYRLFWDEAADVDVMREAAHQAADRPEPSGPRPVPPIV